jgi:hypothetical protein
MKYVYIYTDKKGQMYDVSTGKKVNWLQIDSKARFFHSEHWKSIEAAREMLPIIEVHTL